MESLESKYGYSVVKYMVSVTCRQILVVVHQEVVTSVEVTEVVTEAEEIAETKITEGEEDNSE